MRATPRKHPGSLRATQDHLGATRMASEAPKRPRERSQKAQNVDYHRKHAGFQRFRGTSSLAAKSGPRAPKEPQEDPRAAQQGPGAGQGRPKRGPRAAKSTPRGRPGPGEAKSDLGEGPGAPRAAREPYERIRRGPGAQRGPGQRGTDKRKQEQTRQDEKG